VSKLIPVRLPLAFLVLALLSVSLSGCFVHGGYGGHAWHSHHHYWR
jgi:hypothetical protein